MFVFWQFPGINRTLEQEYHNLSLWYCVSFISGIVTYFSLENEPSFLVISSLSLFILPLIILRRHILWRFILSLIIAFFFGLLISKYRTYSTNHDISYIFHKLFNNQIAGNPNPNLLSTRE